MKLEDINPKKATLYLSALKKTFTLRPISLNDELWLNERFGDKLESSINEGKMRDICAIVFHQLDDEQKQEFKAQDITIINELGESEEIRLGGEKLFASLVHGPKEKLEMFKALLVTLGISQPIVDQLEEKKSQVAIKKIKNDFGKRR